MSVPLDPSYPGQPVARLVPNPKLRFLDQCREVLRFKQMSLRTEEAEDGRRPTDAPPTAASLSSAAWA